MTTMLFLLAPSYLNSRLLGYVTIGYIDRRTHYLGNSHIGQEMLSVFARVLRFGASGCSGQVFQGRMLGYGGNASIHA